MKNTFGDGSGLLEDERPSVPPLAFDPERYAGDVADFDMSEDEKRELLSVVWDIMQTFVNLGFDVGEVDVCGQLFGDFTEAAEGGPDDVESGHPPQQETAHGKDRP